MTNSLTSIPVGEELLSAALLGYRSGLVIDLRVDGHPMDSSDPAVSSEFGATAFVRTLGEQITIDLRTEPPLITLGEQTLPLSVEPPSRRERSIVRVFDVVAASMLTILLLQVFLATWLALRTTSRGPAIFRSPRIDQDGQPFDAFKFRSMDVDAEARPEELLANDDAAREENDRSHKLRKDPRPTPIGSFIRRTSLDELPQFLNVLAGEMSSAGPQPKLLTEPERFGHSMPTILKVKPGMTGLWQVSDRSDLTLDQRIILDLEYALHRTLRSDMAKCLKTARQAFQPTENGAY